MHLKDLPYPTLIGSFPGKDHKEAVEMTFKYCPEIPCWPQIPFYPQEGMLRQFSKGLPAFNINKLTVDINKVSFEEEILAFYEEYMSIIEGNQDVLSSRFAISKEEASGIYILKDMLLEQKIPSKAFKGQVTGPFTLGTGIKTPDEKAIFYDLQGRDLIVKLLTMKAFWQIEFVKDLGLPIIIFLDEPGLAGFGSSAFVGVSEEDIVSSLKEIIDFIEAHGGISGVHVCANTEWSILVKAGVSIISFDAFDYAERFLLFSDVLKLFLEKGGIIAWGIVPTLKPDILKEITLRELWKLLQKNLESLACKTKISKEKIVSQSLITPSCGMGTLPESLAERALSLTRDISQKLREEKI